MTGELTRAPYASFAFDYPGQATIGRHRHGDAQLAYALSGVMVIGTEEGVWPISSRQALWIPPGVEHQIVTRGVVKLRTLYVDPADCSGMPDRCSTVSISTFLRELIVRAADAARQDSMGERTRWLFGLVLDEARAAAYHDRRIETPNSPVLRQVCEEIRKEPGQWVPIDALASKYGISGKTLNRLFRSELNTSFGKWCQQVRIEEAVSRLARGEAVTAIALDLGYASPSAFSAMFRRELGCSPTRYASRRWKAEDATMRMRSES